MNTDKSAFIYLFCLYLVGTAIYSIITIPWSAPAELLVKAILFQGLKLAAGVTLFSRQVVAPYLLSVILLWSIVATGLGFQVSPLTEQSITTIIYMAVNIVFLLAVTLYSFSLRCKGYFVGVKHI